MGQTQFFFRAIFPLRTGTYRRAVLQFSQFSKDIFALTNTEELLTPLMGVRFDYRREFRLKFVRVHMCVYVWVL